jgi:uncharacterized UPF0160 family protein
VQVTQRKVTKEVIRTRDVNVIATGDIVVDVGGKYDPQTLRFDHHQREFQETFNEKRKITRLSSAGLIYKHYGKRIICQLTNWDTTNPNLNVVYDKVYEDLIEGFDAIDNGVSRYSGDALYRDNTNIASRVSRLNPDWNEKLTEEEIMKRFEKAVEIVGEEILYSVKKTIDTWLPTRDIVLKYFDQRYFSLINWYRFQIHASGRIILFEENCPWKEHL